jgi:heme-degrading monooxygenase HmoA
MTTITAHTSIATLINVYTVAPKDQQRVVDLLIAADRGLKDMHGFVSANVHRSADGTRVVEYAQWRTRADFENMTRDPRTQARMREILEIAKADLHLYEVSESIDQVVRF